ncbi:MAG TPA: hypothetical protein VFL17_02640 [Anaerolineae bacterium]|nr:hypothetical protein [Anaerolineae bacterium]
MGRSGGGGVGSGSAVAGVSGNEGVGDAADAETDRAVAGMQPLNTTITRLKKLIATVHLFMVGLLAIR